MIIDSSAILAIVGKEPGYDRVLHVLATAQRTRIGAPTRLETGIVMTARFGPRGKTALSRFLQENAITTVAFGEEHAAEALVAYSRFGKGRHPAALNFGDCCTYAIASLAGEPLLCIGDDFIKTDLPLASLAGQDGPP
ncbi:MAG TPA: type II toxin-antitoxin system VapC family toxin [Streptosporangiaceae bacterium]|nr:type II toxin-antitoxin system VapC family toxin [Streptosporangiaceae bacterium]